MVAMMAGITMGLSAVSATGAEQKVAVVDLARIVKSIPEAKRADEHLEKQAEAFAKERQAHRERMKELQEQFEKLLKAARDPALSEKGRAATRARAEAKLKEVRAEDKKMRLLAVQRAL
jgi:Skp family chaperone for outer membrane proteins